MERPTFIEVAEVLPRAMTEWEISNLPVREAILRIARSIAQDIHRSGEDPLRRMREFERVVYSCGLFGRGKERRNLGR